MFGSQRLKFLFALVIQVHLVHSEDVSCTRIDFDQATVTYLTRCSFYQEFVSKLYSNSVNFNPFREDTRYYLSNKWEGLTCGETVESYSLNEETELRMVYNLIFDYGASLEVRVLDLDRLDSDLNPTAVIRWRTEQATIGWGLFREKMDKTVRRAKIQIEANMNTKSDVAIEYFTVFNFAVETDECQAVDEFATTVVTPTVTSTITSTEESTITTTEEPTSTSVSSTTVMTTAYSPRDETTSTSAQSTVSAEISSSSTDESSTLTITTTILTTSSTNPERAQITDEWLWISLAAIFATLFCLSVAGSAYIYAINKDLLKFNLDLRNQRHDKCSRAFSQNSFNRGKHPIETCHDV